MDTAVVPSMAAMTFVMILKRDLIDRTLLLISVAAETKLRQFEGKNGAVQPVTGG